jgi:hypothetical protein
MISVKVGGLNPQKIKPFQLQNQLIWILIAVLIFSNLILSLTVIKLKPTTQIIAIEEGQTRFLNQEFDEILKEEEFRFSKIFIKKFYNQNFQNLISFKEASLDLNQSLYKEKEIELREKIKLIENQEFTQKIKINSIDEEDLIYTFEVEMTKNLRGNESKELKRLKVELLRTPRTKENPWGLNVNNLKEEILEKGL